MTSHNPRPDAPRVVQPTADEVVLMAIDIALGRTKMRESTVPLVHRSYRKAWRSLIADDRKAKRNGWEVVFPD